MQSNSPIYNTIGKGYNTTRCADPYITSRIVALLQPKNDSLYLDIGCGTGNYLRALSNLGYSFVGADPSTLMLDIAKAKSPETRFVNAFADELPFPDSTFSGATAILTLHHWENKQEGLRELARVLRRNAKIVFFSFTAEQMNGYWLAHYFPEMIAKSGELIPDVTTMSEMLIEAGFEDIMTEKYFVKTDLQDQFLYSNKYNPERYLDPIFRSGISAFAAYTTPLELEEGIKKLQEDIQSGSIKHILKQYENDSGDYLFYVATKS